MPTDAYIRFGPESGDVEEGHPIPVIPGDSDDDQHFWWCELRNCSFELEGNERTEDPDEQSDDDTGEEKARPQVKSVSITKRVDWASAALFRKCCEAPKAKEEQTDQDDEDDDPKGRIKSITVHICRESGGKFPFLIIEYKGIYVTKYHLDISGPEPVETIGFTAEEHSFKYQQTDPLTGEKKGNLHDSGTMESYTEANRAAAQASAAAERQAARAEAAHHASAARAAGGGAAAAAGPGSGNGSGNGTATGTE